MRRTPIKKKPRPAGYEVSPELHAFVRRRDQECMNVNGVPSAVRAFQRKYLRELEGWSAEHRHVDPVYGCVDCYPQVPA